jgi:hypothetical protein
MDTRKEDLTGRTVPGSEGEWKVLSYIKRRDPRHPNYNKTHEECPNRAARYECECTTCGIRRIILNTSLVRGQACCRCHAFFRMLETNATCGSRNFEFNITPEYLWSVWRKQNGICALTGKKIYFNTITDRSASVDRIDSSVGYVEGNIQWVDKDVNIMKNIYPQDMFIETCVNVAQYARKKSELGDK